MNRRRPWIKNADTAAGLAVAFLGVGLILAYDAWEGRGRKAPKLFSILFPN